MLVETHCHTSKYSPCSQVKPVTLIKKAIEKKLNGIIITEHQHQWQEDEIKRLRRTAGVKDSFLILAGQELETEIGHVLVYGGTASIEKPIKLKELKKMFPDAALVWAHPFRYGKDPDKKALLNPLLDAIEVFSGNQEYEENYLGMKRWREYKFNAISGSDIHSVERIGTFPSTSKQGVTTINDVAQSIKNGTCRPSLQRMRKPGGLDCYITYY